MLIRRATLADLDAIVGFNAAMARETEGKALDPSRLSDGVKAVLQQEDLGFYLLAELDGQAVGQLLVTTEWSDWRNAFFWWVQSVYVLPEYRRRGVYRALDQQVRLEAGQSGNVCGVRLYVDQENRVAQQVYQDLGMSQSRYYMYEIEFSG
jgi:GNAT superfamily N-acetyltransferase